MSPEVIKYLAQPRQTGGVLELLNKSRDLLKLSRSEMAKHYDRWDKNDQVYRGEITPDESDKRAASKAQPVKMVVPLTYQQVQTFVAFQYQTFTQRPYFYELAGVGVEDCKAASIGQAALERDLNYNKFKSEKMVEFLTNIARFGVGILKHSWTRETLPVVEQVPDPNFVPDPMNATQPPTIPQVTDAVKYLGNKIVSISPYRFFPDPRLPLTRFAEGEFCGSLDEYARTELENLQRNGDVAGIDLVTSKGLQDVDKRRLVFMKPSLTGNDDKSFVLVEELQLILNPSKTFLDEEQKVPLDKMMDRNVKYLIWIANDQRIIRLEPLSYLHGEFTYDVAQFTPDQEEFINFGLADILSTLQSTISWFVNARVKSVRQIINNKLVVDPSAIEFEDIKSQSPVIRLKRGYAGGGIDQYIKQLNLQDVTTNHLNDVNFLSEWGRDASGITENLLGSFASGRRSATEAKSVNNSAASRLLLIGHTIWDTALGPLGRKLLSNLRQGLDEQTLVQVYGLLNSQADPMAVTSFLQITKADLAGNYDFTIFDGTQPGQRGFTAQALQELVLAMTQDPRMVFVLGYDPKLIIKEILELRDVRNIDRFALSPERAMLYQQMAGGPGNPGNPGGPGQQAGAPA